MFLITNSGMLINLDNIQAITFQKAYTEEYKRGIGTVKSWEKDNGYEVIAETDNKKYVIQEASEITDVIRIMGEIERDIRNIGGEIIIRTPEAAEEIPY